MSGAVLEKMAPMVAAANAITTASMLLVTIAAECQCCGYDKGALHTCNSVPRCDTAGSQSCA